MKSSETFVLVATSENLYDAHKIERKFESMPDRRTVAQLHIDILSVKLEVPIWSKDVYQLVTVRLYRPNQGSAINQIVTFRKMQPC